NEAQGGETTNSTQSTVTKELSTASKVILGALVFAVLMISLTILTLYRAFITMVEVNKELHQKAAQN
ncbi:MAG: cell division protein FtsL, partial [Bacteroidia bacterium]